MRHTKIKIALGIALFLFLAIVFTARLPLLKELKARDISETRTVKLPSPESIYQYFDFSDKKSFPKWKNKIFKGRTTYWIDQKDAGNFLHAKSEKTASALYRLISYDSKEYPIIRWQWQPVIFPDKTGISNPKLRDDYALRLYVIFASGFFTNFKCIEYLWDPAIKEGTVQRSPYSDNIMQIIIQSGAKSADWTTEERNVHEDYIKLFNKKPSMNIRAIAVMSDSEGTQSSCEARFKDIKIIKK